MPINSTHPLYDANIYRWKRCRTAYQGEDAVKAASEAYLPRLGSQEQDEYEAYKTRALFYEAVGRTVDGFVGAIARKPTKATVPEKLQPIIDDVTSNGVSMLEFVKGLCAETLTVGRVGVLVDFDDAAQRAYMAVYLAESIVNWFADGSVVLFETVYESDPADVFKMGEVKQYRHLYINDGRYTVDLYRLSPKSVKGKEEWVLFKSLQPTKRGAAVATIPFFWLTPMGGVPDIVKPPLLGMVNVNLSHYRTSADLEHGRHFTALPTLWVAGAADDTEIRVGAHAAILLGENGSVGYAEFSGAGLSSLERALEEKEQMMAALGAAILGASRKGVEAAETARIRSSSEASLLMGIVSAVEEVFERALAMCADWMAVTGEIDVDMNRDFIDTTMQRGQLTELLGALQSNAITIDTFLFNLQEAEMLAPDRSIEDEKKDLGNTPGVPKVALDKTVKP